MSRRMRRMKKIVPDDRQKLVDLSYATWQACANAMRHIDTRSEDYRAVSRLQAEALAFGQRMAFPDDHRMQFGGPGLMGKISDQKGEPQSPDRMPEITASRMTVT